MICLSRTHPYLIGWVDQHVVYVEVVVPSDSWSPFQPYLHTLLDSLRLYYVKFIDVDKLDIKFFSIVYRVIVGITKLNIVSSWLTSSCQILFAFVVDHIHQVLNILALFDFQLENFRGCYLTSLPEIFVGAAMYFLFDLNWAFLVSFKFNKFSTV